MGTDCCGGAQEAPLAAGLADLSLKSAPARPPSAKKGASNAAPVKSHAECAAELQGFIEKRIKLFEEYAEREREAVRILPPAGSALKAALCLGGDSSCTSLGKLDQDASLAASHTTLSCKCRRDLTAAWYCLRTELLVALRRWRRHALRTSPSQSRCRMGSRCGAWRRTVQRL